jgi:hypothetical protein
MGGFYQLAKHSYQSECRLLVKHCPHDSMFPFKITYDAEQECNFIECDLIRPTCADFQVRLTEVVAGRNRTLDEVQSYIADHSIVPGLSIATE